MKKTKKSLLFSGLALMMSALLLAGTTFAWFTDSVTNKGNKIEAGTLDVQLYQDTTDISNSTEPVFNYDKWEPGYSTGADLSVKNNGTLAIKYELELQNVTATKGIENVINVYVGKDLKGTLAQFMNGENLLEGTLNAGASTDSTMITLAMQTSADNDYQGATASFDILLKATQAPVETDGFGNPNYDANATYDSVTVTVGDSDTANGAALQEAINEVEDGGTVFVPAGEFSVGTISLGDKDVVLQGSEGTVLTSRQDEGFITVRGADGAKLTVRDMTFTGTANNDGSRGICFSGQMNSNITAVVENCTFEELNTGIYLGGVANATVTGCTFTNCAAGIGGTDDITGQLTVSNCDFSGLTEGQETIGWAGTGRLVIKNCPTCTSFNDYTGATVVNTPVADGEYDNGTK